MQTSMTEDHLHTYTYTGEIWVCECGEVMIVGSQAASTASR